MQAALSKAVTSLQSSWIVWGSLNLIALTLLILTLLAVLAFALIGGAAFDSFRSSFPMG
ncbi:hypothetical protein EC9_44380 [Rosistilla ulvae]|uniref:Uncharacterized protein n=1 Tax=Rosistilla ulvae TaxID=1930277 RepID=A0A517M5T8_9BACT|nr:hypothetical protein EC9_44380 [Rosistilla ulvae]